MGILLALTHAFMFFPAQYVPFPFTHVSGGSSVTFVQSTSPGTLSGGTSIAIVSGSNQTAGNTSLICATWGTATGTATINAPTDTQGNTYTLVPSSLATVAATDFANIYTECAYSLSIIGGANTVTVTFSAAVASGIAVLYELTASHFDAAAIATANAAAGSGGPGLNSAAAASITPSANGAFVMALCNFDNNFGFGSGWFTATSGWTLRQQYDGGGKADGVSVDQAQSTATSVTANLNSGFTSTHGPWTQSIISFKP